MRSTIRALLAKLTALFSARRMDEDLRQQIDDHLEMLTADFEKRGFTTEDARRQARLAFGGSAQALERHREQRSFIAFDRLLQDVRYAWRGLRRTPGFAAVAIVTLALGIGANTAFFGLVDAVVFRPTAVAQLDRVYAVTTKHPELPARTSYLRTMDAELLERVPPASVAAVTSVAGRSRADTTNLIQIEGRAEYVLGERVTAGYAAVFGLHAQTGRWFADEDANPAAPVVVISDRLWRQWFKADPEIAGRALITINGTSVPHRVIGIAPPGFRGVQTGLAPTEIWRLIEPPIIRADQPRLAEYYAHDRTMLTFIRARSDVSRAQATGEVRAMLTRRPDPDPAADTLELQRGQDALRVNEFVMLAAGILSFSSLVFFAACANLANMLYARGADRAGEIAVRLSLGASARNIVGLFLAEAAIIAFIAASAGLAVAVAATSAFASAFPTFRLARNLGVSIDLSPDYRVFVYAFGTGAIAALAVGLLAAWRSSRVPILRAIGGSTTTNVVSSRRRGLPLTFVSVQITAAVLLLIGAGLFLENTQSLLDRRIYYDTSQLAAARVTRLEPPRPALTTAEVRALGPDGMRKRFAEEQALFRAEREAFFARVLDNARAIPGVEAAAIADALPGGTAPAPQWGKSALQGAPAEAPGVVVPRRLDGSWISASPGFLDTIGVKLARGRGIQTTDRVGAPLVAVLSKSAAEGLWPGEDPLGRKLHCCKLLDTPITVVGIADDPVSSSDTSPLTRHSNFVFLPAAQTPTNERFIVIRTANPAGQVEALRAAVHAADATAPVFDAGPVDEFLLAGVALERAQRVLTVSLGLLALGIAMFGVYGVVGYYVSRRTREFGLRLALGAVPRQILKLVVDYAIHIILIGLLPGVFIASVGTRLFEGGLFGLMPNSIAMWIVAPLFMLAAGVVAGLIPARRAARVDPNVTLRDL